MILWYAFISISIYRINWSCRYYILCMYVVWLYHNYYVCVCFLTEKSFPVCNRTVTQLFFWSWVTYQGFQGGRGEDSWGAGYFIPVPPPPNVRLVETGLCQHALTFLNFRTLIIGYPQNYHCAPHTCSTTRQCIVPPTMFLHLWINFGPTYRAYNQGSIGRFVISFCLGIFKILTTSTILFLNSFW